MSRSVLLVDDDHALAEVLAEQLDELGFEVRSESDPRQAVELLRRGGWGALVTDLRMPGHDGLDLLALSRQLAPERPVIVMTAFSAIDTAIESIRRGAYHYLTKPFQAEELALFLGRAFDAAELVGRARSLERELRGRSSFGALQAASPAMRGICEVLTRVAETSLSVLITGETGTGKGLVARAVHEESGRGGRFVTINCAALPGSLLESELFGHVKGAFTGASAARTGLFVEADRGTLFLDEIGDMTPALQAKLLDVLERGVVRPLGSNREHAVDARIVAATHHDLQDAVVTGRFREDLYYRLAAVAVELPPLRARRQDIPLLIDVLLERARRAYPKARGARFSEGALRRLLDAPWPGNVRELENAVSRAVVLATGEEIDEARLPPAVAQSLPPASGFLLGDEILPMRQLQRRYAEWALEQLGGRKNLACERLAIDPKTLRKLLGEEG